MPTEDGALEFRISEYLFREDGFVVKRVHGVPASDLTAPMPDLCHHPNRQRTMQPSGGWVKVTCPDCPAEAAFDARIHDDVQMAPWLRSAEES